MKRREARAAARDWIAAGLLGLLTSTWSTLVSHLAAARLGRDAWTDWMIVASIPMQDAAIQAEPGWFVTIVGIAFHQSADFVWALAFFGLLGRWTARLRPWTIAALSLPWAVFTSAAEYFVIVPFWQPVFVLEQPYWIGLLVHATSAGLYPLFPWLRDAVTGVASPHRRFALRWSAAAAAGLGALAIVAALGAARGEWPPHAGPRAEADAAWMARMAAHHAQGIEIARLAETRAEAPRLRALARLMVATQAGDIAVFESWHRGWFDAKLALAGQAGMPGMLGPAELSGLAESRGPAFDGAFIARMSQHHLGALAMAEEALTAGGDPRLRVMAHALRHAQRGEVQMLHGIPRGFAVSAAAWDAMFAPFGAGAAERRVIQAAEGQSHHSSSAAAASHNATITAAPPKLRGR